MYNNGDAKLLQYILNEILQKQKKSYPAVGLSRQKIYEAKSQQQVFLVITDVAFVVIN